MKDLDLHMTQLVGWAVRIFGKAIIDATVPGAVRRLEETA